MASLNLGLAASTPGAGAGPGASNGNSLAGSMHGTLIPMEEDEEGRVEKMELLVGDVKGKVSTPRRGRMGQKIPS